MAWKKNQKGEISKTKDHEGKEKRPGQETQETNVDNRSHRRKEEIREEIEKKQNFKKFPEKCVEFQLKRA